MRTLSVSLTLLLLCGVAYSEPDKREVKRAIELYVQSDDEDIKEHALKTLRVAKEKQLQSPLKKALNDEKMRAGVLKLAGVLGVDIVKYALKHLDGEHEKHVIEYLGSVSIRNEKADEALWERWNESDDSGERQGMIVEAWTKHAISFERIKALKDAADDEECSAKKRADAMAIVEEKMGATEEEIRRGWEKLEADYVFDARSFELKGSDMTQLPQWGDTEGVLMAGDNFRLQSNEELQLIPMPPSWAKKSITVTFRVRVKGDAVGFTFKAEKAHWRAKVKGHKWKMQISEDEENSVPAKLLRWSTVRIEVVYAAKYKDEGWRRVKVFVDDQELLPAGGLPGKLEEFTVLGGE
ncbi:MAG: hypothetical protein OEY28_05620, partial [Nitrospira sp.]|nr:hypothetical protein [Nitrospira sp.]